MFPVLALLCLPVIGTALRRPDWQPFREAYPVWEPRPVEKKGLAEPLILSKSILEGGNLEEARKSARVVHEDIAALADSYSGFITVDPKHNSNLFFWYFPAKSGKVGEDPVVVWLQGGPGATSLYGLFEEIGPLSVTQNGTLSKENPHSWHNNLSLIFIDNPVGTGFSFTDSEEGYATNQEEIAEHLYTFLIQFFKLFPELQSAPFFIAGESYAGFSFTDSEEGYATNQEEIAEHLYTFLIQFFKLFPELQSAPFFIAGESYADGNS